MTSGNEMDESRNSFDKISKIFGTVLKQVGKRYKHLLVSAEDSIYQSILEVPQRHPLDLVPMTLHHRRKDNIFHAGSALRHGQILRKL